MTNSWAAAAPPPPGPLVCPRKLEPSSMALRFLSLAAPSPRRPALRRNRGPPALSCQRGDFASKNTTSGGGGGICSDWDWNRWNQHFSETDQAESFSSLLKVGWWAGWAKDSGDPFGRIVRITPAVGRYIAKSYSPSPTTDEVGSKSSKDSEEENKEDAAKIRNVDNVIRKDSDDEGLKSIINFFKERIPGFNVNLANNSVQEEIKMDAGSSEQLMQEDDEKDGSPEYSTTDDSKSENSQGEMLSDGEDADSTNRSKNMAVKLFVGGVLHNKDESMTKSYKRIPAEMKDVEKGSFTLYLSRRSSDPHIVERKPEKIRVASVATQSASDLMPPDVANAFFSSDKAISKVGNMFSSKDNAFLFPWNSLKSYLSDLAKFSLPSLVMASLYVGAFGPYGVEVVQLQRKYGHWNGTDELGSDIEFFEYVEAVKLTGDLNVPAGQACSLLYDAFSAFFLQLGLFLIFYCEQVTFRAKIGKGNRQSNRGMYPEELGVGLGPYVRGTELGFLYVVPEQKFLVLFERLTLPD
ncbi:hypothetical protein B296_00025619 [Ensete ventricosum]|uniref:Uncharacterized protein n=1 Tax=Ensete ventricosum TaxID=4639 RepID=A0A427AL09_ENSVE|nr:hypothetical protein B296_00025619 [Ensete ventricosum]